VASGKEVLECLSEDQEKSTLSSPFAKRGFFVPGSKVRHYKK
jgi:hypothetical protein